MIFTVDNIYEVYSNTVGDCVTSLGDDTASMNVVYVDIGIQFNKLSKMYLLVANWEVELKKSLVGRTTFEYLREQGHGGYVCSVKMFNKADEFTMKKVTCICKPTIHVCKTFFAEESKSRISKLIDAIAEISKAANLNLHPRLDLFIDGILKYNVSRFKLFTEPIDYVPIWNTKAWVSAGKPAVPNKFSVKITGMDSAFTLAGKESSWYVQNVLHSNEDPEEFLLEKMGVSWTKSNMQDYDHISSLKASRLYRYLVAKYKHDDATCRKIINEVQLIPGVENFYKSINGIGQQVDEVEDVIDPVILSASY